MLKIICLVSLASLAIYAQDLWQGEAYAKHSTSQKLSAERFLERVTLHPTDRLLDVGCGDGKISARLASDLPMGSVVGVDLSPSMLTKASQAFGEVANLSFSLQDAAHLGFQEEFDVITSFTVMHWVLEQDLALEGFKKALRPKGRLYIQMPTALPHAMEKALQVTVKDPQWGFYLENFSPPWHFYTEDEYRQLLVAHGFSITFTRVVTDHETFPSREAFHGFLKQWFPYLRPLPEELKEPFLQKLLDNYVQEVSFGEEVPFVVDRLEVAAIKP